MTSPEKVTSEGLCEGTPDSKAPKTCRRYRSGLAGHDRDHRDRRHHATRGENLLTTLPDAGWQPSSSWSDSRHFWKRRARVVPIAALLLKKNKKPFFSARNVIFTSRGQLPRDP
jgi:hypothetical protein